MANETALNSTSFLLALPAEITEDIFTRVFDWIDLRLLLEVNKVFFHECLSQDDYLLSKSTRIATYTGGRSKADLGAWLAKRTTPCQTLPNFQTLMFIERSDSAKYWTLRSLLLSCRQIRAQVGELFWRHQKLVVRVGLHKSIRQDISPILGPCFDFRFATGQARWRLQHVDLEIHIACSIPRRDYETSTSASSCRPIIAMKQILMAMPNLRHLTLAFAFQGRIGEWGYFCVLDELLKSLREFETLRSVHLKGKGYQEQDLCYSARHNFWSTAGTRGLESSGEVEEMRSTAFGKTAFVFEGVSFRSLEQMLVLSSRKVAKLRSKSAGGGQD